MNVALVFAGGTGQRMNSKTVPKQFLKLHDKPVIIYTLEHFESHNDIDGIVVVCLEEWIPQFKKMLKKFDIEKVVSVVPGGSNGQSSIYNGLVEINRLYPDDTVVLVHDGVRPLIDDETITKNIQSVKEKGNAITVVGAIETITIDNKDGEIGKIVTRDQCQIAKAPQSFILRELLEAHNNAIKDGRNDFIDSATLMRHYGHRLFSVPGKSENIKITTPSDFYIFRAIIDAQEATQISGL